MACEGKDGGWEGSEAMSRYEAPCPDVVGEIVGPFPGTAVPWRLVGIDLWSRDSGIDYGPARCRLATAWAKTPSAGWALARDTQTRRTETRTRAPILSSRVRIVPQ